MNFHHNEIYENSIWFIGHKTYSKKWTIRCGLGVDILNVLYLM